MTWWVLLNPTAGRGRVTPERVVAALDAAGVRHRLVVSPSAEAVAALVDEAVVEGFRDLAVVGGDGTLHLVLNAVLGHRWDDPPTLGILPAGSGSDFARTFALPRDLEAAAAHLAGEGRYRCDVGRIDGAFGSRWFLNAANVGVAAAAARVAARLPAGLGPRRYQAAFWMVLPCFRPARVVVTTERSRTEGETMNVVLANGQFFGGGLNVAPRASAGDGRLDVQVFAGPRRRALSVMPRLLRGAHLGRPGVRRLVAARATVEVPDDWPVEADGETVGTGSVAVTVVPGAVDFKV